MAKTSMNLEENVAGLICYLGLWVTGIIFFLMEGKNKTVRFHAMQSIITFLPLTILASILTTFGAVSYQYHTVYGVSYPTNASPSITWYIGMVIWAITGITWLILMFKTYQGEKFKLPIVGDIAEKHA